MPNLQLDTDCEGPLALNDNAFELCREFIKPQGDRFFQQVSRYDDYLAEVEPSGRGTNPVTPSNSSCPF